MELIQSCIVTHRVEIANLIYHKINNEQSTLRNACEFAANLYNITPIIALDNYLKIYHCDIVHYLADHGIFLV